jgi:hypothetical protein
VSTGWIQKCWPDSLSKRGSPKARSRVKATKGGLTTSSVVDQGHNPSLSRVQVSIGRRCLLRTLLTICCAVSLILASYSTYMIGQIRGMTSFNEVPKLHVGRRLVFHARWSRVAQNQHQSREDIGVTRVTGRYNERTLASVQGSRSAQNTLSLANGPVSHGPTARDRLVQP